MQWNDKITIQNADLRLIREDAVIYFSDRTSVHNVISDRCRQIWKAMLKILRKMGFRTYIKKEFRWQFECLVEFNLWGSYHQLKFRTEIYPAGFSIEFYQDLYHEIEQYKKMPPDQQKLFEQAIKLILDGLSKTFSLRMYDQSDLQIPPLTAEEHIIKHIRERVSECANYHSLADIANSINEYDQQSGIKGDILHCGETRRIRKYNTSQDFIGIIYYNLNNMWWVIESKYRYHNVANFEIFELAPQQMKVSELSESCK
jgi:hypothetical protein